MVGLHNDNTQLKVALHVTFRKGFNRRQVPGKILRRALLPWLMTTEELEGIKFPVSSSLSQVKLVPNGYRKPSFIK